MQVYTILNGNFNVFFFNLRIPTSIRNYTYPLLYCKFKYILITQFDFSVKYLTDSICNCTSHDYITERCIRSSNKLIPNESQFSLLRVLMLLQKGPSSRLAKLSRAHKHSNKKLTRRFQGNFRIFNICVKSINAVNCTSN